MVRKILLALCLALISVLPTQSPFPAQPRFLHSAQAASRVKLNKADAALVVGDTLKLRVRGTKKKARWSSSNACIAKVNRKGLVTALEPGEAVITAKVGRKKLKCRVKVSADPTPVMTTDPVVVLKKPIIYLYPEEEAEITVKLGMPENITASYPAYADGWRVMAGPDGTLTDIATGRTLYALYWEGRSEGAVDIAEGFVVAGTDTAAFLEEKLDILGLSEREAEEFIVYWLPEMRDNPYNLIRFLSTDEITDRMPLAFSVEPDTVIRVFMVYRRLEERMEIAEQQLPERPVRNGFTAVEWGGSALRE